MALGQHTVHIGIAIQITDRWCVKFKDFADVKRQDVQTLKGFPGEESLRFFFLAYMCRVRRCMYVYKYINVCVSVCVHVYTEERPETDSRSILWSLSILLMEVESLN